MNDPSCAEPLEPARGQPAKPTVLCVDDEPHVLSSLKRLLRKEPYTVLAADNVRLGLELLSRHRVHVLISDQRMPEMSGVEFVQKVKEISSDTVRCILSGYVDAGLIVDSINKGEVFRFLTKPWNDEEIKAAIRQCLTHYDIVLQNRALHDQVRTQNERLRLLNLEMEEMVQFRTRSLHVTQEVLENIPLAVIGVSREGMVLLVNRAAEQLVDSLCRLAPGTDLNDVFPPDAARAVTHRLHGNPAPSSLVVLWDGTRLHLEIQPLSDHGVIRGCIVIMRKFVGCTDPALPCP